MTSPCRFCCYPVLKKRLMINDGDLRCTTVPVLAGFSSSFSDFLSSPFAFSLSRALSSCPFFPILVGLYERTDDSCEDWLCDRLLSPPSEGVWRDSCSVDRRNLFKLSLRTRDCDFFFFFFKVAAELSAAIVGFCSFLSSDCCRDTSKAEEDRESRKTDQPLENHYPRMRERANGDLFNMFCSNR